MSISCGVSPVYNETTFQDNNGNVAAGFYVWAFTAGSFTTQQTIYSDLGLTPITQPIQLTASGRLPTGVTIFLTLGYSYQLALSSDALGQNIIDYKNNVVGVPNPAVVGVTQIIAGTDITISPTGGTGAVTINSTGGGGSGTAFMVGLENTIHSGYFNTFKFTNVVFQTASDYSPTTGFFTAPTAGTYLFTANGYFSIGVGGVATDCSIALFCSNGQGISWTMNIQPGISNTVGGSMIAQMAIGDTMSVGSGNLFSPYIQLIGYLANPQGGIITSFGGSSI